LNGVANSFDALPILLIGLLSPMSIDDKFSFLEKRWTRNDMTTTLPR